MNFSVFDNDDETFGDLADARVVVLKGSTTVSQLFSPNFFPIDRWLRTALEIAGFSVNAVRSSAAAWIGYALNIEIEIEVYNRHTSEQARSNAIRAIEAYTANYGLNKVFSNTTLSVTFDAFVPPSTGGSQPPRTGGVKPSPSPSPPSSYDQTNTRGQQQGGSAFLDNLGLGLGVSTPVVIGTAALLVVLMLKR